MIVFSRKRIMLILSIIFISTFCFTLNETNRVEETVQTVALPISNKVIVIDARTSVSLMKVQKVQMEQQKHKQI